MDSLFSRSSCLAVYASGPEVPPRAGQPSSDSLSHSLAPLNRPLVQLSPESQFLTAQRGCPRQVPCLPMVFPPASWAGISFIQQSLRALCGLSATSVVILSFMTCIPIFEFQLALRGVPGSAIFFASVFQ